MPTKEDLKDFDRDSRAEIRAYLADPREVLYLERLGDECSAQILPSGTQGHLIGERPDAHYYIKGFGMTKAYVRDQLGQALQKLG